MCVVEFGAAGGGRIRWSRLLNAERDPVQSWGPSAESGTQCRIGIQHSVIWIFYRQRLGSPRTDPYTARKRPSAPPTARPADRLSEDKLTPKSMNGVEQNSSQTSARQTLKESILKPNPRG